MTSDTTKAKRIVNNDLENWRGNLSDLQRKLIRILAHKNFKNFAQREKLIKKFRKTSLANFYCREVTTKFSNTIACLSPLESEPDAIGIVRKSSSADIAYKKHQNKNNNTFHTFVVKDDISNESGLHIIMCDIRSKDCKKLNSFHSVARVTRHCLERVVERMNLNNIREALDEILQSSDFYDASGFELSVRKKKNQKPEFKRHIPTPTGACLLQTSISIDSNGEEVQSCNLITWIHKKQFFENQKVTEKRYNYALSVNTYLSMTDLKGWRDNIKKNSGDISKQLVDINGEVYDLANFISDLDREQFLDFEIDFERYKSSID
ncbi:hypothetical protein P3602_25640 [Vibrio parahaemolyticus]|nr:MULTISPECIES: hypothetical protein [Vibrio]EGQ9760777.1 hypothetical protein [Vibrio parahaemolyticus]EJL3959816.1 hypothetical protein [Vibrio parahaemolyticus]ELZ7201028.1 hypothetical protein [Vibrio parahaemolyticus]MBE3821493.1 hypothetical protein [Vibrio parahaemolyticus]MBE3924298.1 hypothetical protein [Vibrio parahaemolyticus]